MVKTKKHVQADDVLKSKEYNTYEEKKDRSKERNETELVDPDAAQKLVDPDALPYPTNVSKIDLNRDRITYGGNDSKWIRHNFYAVAPYVGAVGVAGAAYGTPGVRSTLETFLPFIRNARIAQEETNERKRAEDNAAAAQTAQEKPPALPLRGVEKQLADMKERLKDAETVEEIEKVKEQIKQLETKAMDYEQIRPSEMPTQPSEIPKADGDVLMGDRRKSVEDVVMSEREFISYPGPPQVFKNRYHEKSLTRRVKPTIFMKDIKLKQVTAKIRKLITNVNEINPPRITATTSKVLKPLTLTTPVYFQPKQVTSKIGKFKTEVNEINPQRITATTSRVLKPLTLTTSNYRKRKAITRNPTSNKRIK